MRSFSTQKSCLACEVLLFIAIVLRDLVVVVYNLNKEHMNYLFYLTYVNHSLGLLIGI